MKHWQFISLYNSEHQHLPPVQTVSSLVDLMPCRIIPSAVQVAESPPQSCPAAILVFFLAVDYGPPPLTCCLFKVLQALLPWQAGEDSLISALHLCTGSPESGLPPLPEADGVDFGPRGSPWCGAALAETEMHTLNSTCKKNCLPRVLSVLSYR